MLDVNLNHNEVYVCWLGIMMCYDNTQGIPETCCVVFLLNIFHLIKFSSGSSRQNAVLAMNVWLCNLWHEQVGVLVKFVKCRGSEEAT